MKESLRRIILFIVIVATGSVLILFDVPLTILVPLILTIGVIVLVLLGAITPADIRSVFRRPKFENLKKISFLKRLDDKKFFERKPQKPDKKTSVPKKKEEPAVKGTPKIPPVSPLRSFISSLGSLGTVIKERSRQKKKVEHINELLDKAVGEKVKGSVREDTGKGAGPGSSPLEGGGGASAPGGAPATEQDPFMSLSGDEFDVSFLDGLDESEAMEPSAPSGQGITPAERGPGQTIREPVIAMSELDISSEVGDILKNNAGDLEEFSSLEGGESLDQDFKDLDNLSLDDIDLDIDLGEAASETAGSAPEDAPVSVSAPAETPSVPVKTAWIPSDAPKNAAETGDQISLQADMSSFSKGASGSDEDLLSSLASDVKHVKKERNLSLLRDLKDFKAPATEIETELNETSEWLKNSLSRKVKVVPPAKGMK